MKRILSMILVIGMLFTLAPMNIAAVDVLATAKTADTAYTAKVGETVAVPFQIVPVSGTLETGVISATIAVPEGLKYTITEGIAKPADDTDVFSQYDDAIIIWYESEVSLTADNNTICTVNFTAEEAGEYVVGFDAEWVDLLDANLDPLASAYDGNIAVQTAKIKFEADAPVVTPDTDFDKFKAKGVYYDASEDTTNAGTGVGMHMNASSLYSIYDVSTDEGLAAFKANSNYETAYTYTVNSASVETTLGGAIETAITNKSAKYASYTSNDSAYNFTTYEGKPALYGVSGVATRFVGNWKENLGAPNMYYMIDDEYFASTDTDATIVIQYYDNTGSFSFRYSKQGGGANVFSVTKGGTNTWVTKAFQVNDAMLNAGLTATGLIDNKHTGRIESASETYISKFAILKTADYNEIMGIVPDVPELPELDETLPADASAFLKNSTLVAKLDFDSGNFTKDAKVTTAIDGFVGYSVDDNYYLDTPEVDTGSLAAHLYRDTTKVANSVTTQFATWTPENAVNDAPYMIVTYKSNTNADYNRVNLGFNYKLKSNGGVNLSGEVASSDDNGLPMIIRNGTISREGKTSSPWNDPENTGCDNSVTIEANKYQGAEHTYTYLIDTIAKKAYLYIDGEYVLSLVIYRNRNHSYYADELNTTYVSGIKSIKFAQDRGGKATDGTGIMQTYYDDVMIRRVSDAQFAAIKAEVDAPVVPATLEAGAKLPTTTNLGTAITWTTNNANVVVTDGVVEIVDLTLGNSYDVEFTATFGGATAKYNSKVTSISKYAEYTFGAKEDKAYGLTSFNVADNYYTQTKDGLTIRNSIVKFDEPRTMYFIVDDPANPSATAASHEVTKEEYDASELAVGTGKQSYNVTYYNTSAMTGDSAMNRYDAIGPDGDKRAAVFGTSHLRNDTRLARKWTNSMIHFDAGSTFSATDNALTIEVDVLDVGTHTVSLQYCSVAGTIATVNSAPLTNTGEWITLKYELTDADFAWTKDTGLGNNKQDFRFQLNVPTYISAVRVYNNDAVDVADADYTKVAVADYDVIINEDNSITAKMDITAEEAADAKLYVAYYNAKGNLVGVATSAQVTDGAAQTVVTGASVGATYNTVDYTLKTFLWDEDLKPLR